MKKLLLIMMSLAAVAVVSCKKGDDNKDNKEPDAPKFRIATLTYCGGDNLAKPEDAEWPDTWTYTYDDQGRVIDVDRNDGDDKHWQFVYKDNTVTISNKSGKEVLILTLNDKGVCTSIVDDVKESEWGPYKETAIFTYDETLRPTKIEKEGELRSEITLRDNCLVSWTKTKDNNRKRIFTYTNTKNIGDLHAIYSEAIDPPARWLYETGMFGKGPAYLPATSEWENEPDTKSTLTCKVDENGYCIEEKKAFEGGWTEFFVIKWEEVK